MCRRRLVVVSRSRAPNPNNRNKPKQLQSDPPTNRGFAPAPEELVADVTTP